MWQERTNNNNELDPNLVYYSGTSHQIKFKFAPNLALDLKQKKYFVCTRATINIKHEKNEEERNRGSTLGLYWFSHSNAPVEGCSSQKGAAIRLWLLVTQVILIIAVWRIQSKATGLVWVACRGFEKINLKSSMIWMTSFCIQSGLVRLWLTCWSDTSAK